MEGIVAWNLAISEGREISGVFGYSCPRSCTPALEAGEPRLAPTHVRRKGVQ